MSNIEPEKSKRRGDDNNEETQPEKKKMTRTIHYCNFCDYKSDRRYDRDKHVNRKHAHTMNSNRNKQVACKICYRKMRSDVLQRHMKVHEIHFLDEGEATFNQLCKNKVNEAMKKPLVDSEANQEMNYDSQRPSKRKIEDFDAEGAKLRKYLNKHNDEYNRKIVLGKEVYKILGEGNIQEASLPKEMKEALTLYMTNDHDTGLDG